MKSTLHFVPIYHFYFSLSLLIYRFVTLNPLLRDLLLEALSKGLSKKISFMAKG